VSFAAPFFLAAGALAALAIVALHFLARQRPRAAPFPTARFIPERPARAPSRALQPTDLLLLLLRVMAVLFLGAAFARPAWERPRDGARRVVMVDRSRAVALAADARDSAAAWLRPGDALVLFDSAARVVGDGAADSLRAMMRVAAAGSISGALVAAQQAAAGIAAHADSLELVLVSPLAREEFDAATRDVRGQWPGALRLVRVAAAPAARSAGALTIRGEQSDALRTSGLGARPVTSNVRIVRDAATAGDSAWAADSGGVLVHWPASIPGSDSARALVVGNVVVVAPFARAAVPPGAPMAWWEDGRAAAVERRTRTGCIRDAAIGVPAAGDLVLRESFRRAFEAMIAPCGGAADTRVASDSTLAMLRGGAGLAPARAWTRNGDAVPPLSRWLLVGAAVLLVAEPLVRRRSE